MAHMNSFTKMIGLGVITAGAILAVIAQQPVFAEVLQSKSGSSAQKGGTSYPAYNFSNNIKTEFNRPFAEALSTTMKTAGSAAKHFGSNVNQYVQTIQVEKRQREILNSFYDAYYFYSDSYELPYEEKALLKRLVEEVYYEEALKEDPEIDMVNFYDMPYVIKKVYADMQTSKIVIGTLKTYYLTGELHTTWTYRDKQPDGPAVLYGKKGDILFIDTYLKGSKINRKKYDAEGKLEFSQDYPHPFEEANKENPTTVAAPKE